MTKKLKKNLIRICISLPLFIILFIVDKIIDLNSIIKDETFFWILPAILYLIVYLIIGYDVLLKAIKNIFKGQIFDENFLMCLATLGAFLITEYEEAVAVLLFYQIGEWFQGYAVGKSRKSISSLMDIRPDFANLKMADLSYQEVDPSIVHIGDIILVKPGEKVPLDGIIIKGNSTLDMKALTGESLPVDVNENNEIMSGCINLSGSLEIKVTKEFHDSTVSKILELVENATSVKSKSENFISKFARYYTPIVVIGAVALVLLGGSITSNWLLWFKRSLNFLVVSCPCALVISIPLTFFAGIGRASSEGILIKGSAYIEKFNRANIFVFDKTGTLTKGNFKVVNVEPESLKDEILHLAAIAEQNSNHPIAKSIMNCYGKNVEEDYEIKDIVGKGIIASNSDNVIYCGNEKLMCEYKIDFCVCEQIGTIIYVAKNKEFIGYILIKDEIKQDAKEMIEYLNTNHSQSIMLTGDSQKIALDVANELALNKVYYSLLPQGKVEKMDEIFQNKNEKDVICFLGDGINDAPVLMKADVGIAMGGVGSDAAIEASDIVLMSDQLSLIKTCKIICKRTIQIVYQNIYFSLLVKALVLFLSIFGFANMWLAIFADVGVSVICILNAMRMLIKNKNKKKN